MAHPQTRQLGVHDEPTDGWGTFCPDDGPAFVGHAPGISWLCPACGNVLVEGAMHEDQFLDLLFRCYGCGQVGSSPVRQPGRPLAGRPLLSPPGSYRLGSPVSLRTAPVMLVGQQALDGYIRETGAGMTTGPALTEFSEAGFRRLAQRLTELLGDRYRSLRDADDRGKASPTPPPRRHRCIELIDYAEQIATGLGERGNQPQVEIDGNLLSELISTVTLLHRWRNHPSCTQLVQTLATETEGPHTVMLLGVASYLADAGNGIGIVDDRESVGRIPDLWAEPALGERLDIEIKTPQELRIPRTVPLKRDEAVRLIERQVDEAASTKRGQISPDGSGVVAIGGFHQGPAALDQLEACGGDVLSRQASRKRHLAALVLCDMSYQASEVVQQTGGRQFQFTPTLQTRVIKHPGYTGGLTLDTGQPPWRVAAAA